MWTAPFGKWFFCSDCWVGACSHMSGLFVQALTCWP